MPSSKVTSVEISQVWDDESETTYKIRFGKDVSSDPYVVLAEEGCDGSNIYPEVWEEIKTQIDGYFESC